MKTVVSKETFTLSANFFNNTICWGLSMKKTFSLLVLCSILSACATTGGSDATESASVNQVRGRNAARVTDAEIKQYNKQRANELTEQAAKSAKTRMQMENVKEGIETAKQGIGLIQIIMDTIKR